MSYNNKNRVPTYALYGVPEDEAYGRANGGVPTTEAYRLANRQLEQSQNNFTEIPNQVDGQNDNSNVCSYFQNNKNTQNMSILPKEENYLNKNGQDSQNIYFQNTNNQSNGTSQPQNNNYFEQYQNNILQVQQPDTSLLRQSQNNNLSQPDIFNNSGKNSNYLQKIIELLNVNSVDKTQVLYQQSENNIVDNIFKVSIPKVEQGNGVEKINNEHLNDEKIQQKNEFDEDNSKTNSYIFSDNMRNLLGFYESKNNYQEVLNDKTPLGAIGRYQFRAPTLIDIGYLNKEQKWTGKNNIFSLDDFLKNQNVQEKALDECLRLKELSLKKNGAYDYLGYPIKGIKANFNISKTGLLAASHRLGEGNVIKYLKLLEKDNNGKYYINYDNIKDVKVRSKYKAIETRLREFEK